MACPYKAQALPTPISHQVALTWGSFACKSLTLPKSKNVLCVKPCEKTASFVEWREQGQRCPPSTQKEHISDDNRVPSLWEPFGETCFSSSLLSSPQTAEEDALYCLRSYNVGCGCGTACPAPPQVEIWAEIWVLHPSLNEQIKELGPSFIVNKTVANWDSERLLLPSKP